MGGVGGVGVGGMLTTMLRKHTQQYHHKSRFTRYLQYFRHVELSHICCCCLRFGVGDEMCLRFGDVGDGMCLRFGDGDEICLRFRDVGDDDVGDHDGV